MILIIDKRDMTVRYESGSLRLERKEHKLQRIPLKQLEQVIVFGNPLIESSVWRQLAHAGVPAAILGAHGKKAAAMLGSGLATTLPFRRMQHAAAGDPAAALSQARYFLMLKIGSYDVPLYRLEQLYPVDEEDAGSFRQQCARTLDKVRNAESMPQMMGLEGQLAQAWFALLAKNLPYRWKFAGRNRRPPRDPVNALLSLGYTLLSSEIHQLLIGSGLDPALGFLHQDYPGRDSLMLDFSEIFRSGVDAFVLRWLAENEELEEGAFYYREEQGCRLSKKVRPLFFSAWAHHRYHWPRPVVETKSAVEESWPEGEIRELANGQIMAWREHLKANTPGSS